MEPKKDYLINKSPYVNTPLTVTKIELIYSLSLLIPVLFKFFYYSKNYFLSKTLFNFFLFLIVSLSVETLFYFLNRSRTTKQIPIQSLLQLINVSFIFLIFLPFESLGGFELISCSLFYSIILKNLLENCFRSVFNPVLILIIFWFLAFNLNLSIPLNDLDNLKTIIKNSFGALQGGDWGFFKQNEQLLTYFLFHFSSFFAFLILIFFHLISFSILTPFFLFFLGIDVFLQKNILMILSLGYWLKFIFLYLPFFVLFILNGSSSIPVSKRGKFIYAAMLGSIFPVILSRQELMGTQDLNMIYLLFLPTIVLDLFVPLFENISLRLKGEHSIETES